MSAVFQPVPPARKEPEMVASYVPGTAAKLFQVTPASLQKFLGAPKTLPDRIHEVIKKKDYLAYVRDWNEHLTDKVKAVKGRMCQHYVINEFVDTNFLPEAERKKAEARLAVFLQKDGARALIEAAPAGEQPDWGFTFHKIQSLRRAYGAGRLPPSR